MSGPALRLPSSAAPPVVAAGNGEVRAPAPVPPGDEPTADPLVVAALDEDRRRRRRRRLGAVALGIGIAALAVVLVVRGTKPTAPQFHTRPAERGALVLAVTATGTVEPKDVVDVGADLSGRVRRVLVDVNDHVEEGQVLLELAPDVLDLAVQQAWAGVATAFAGRQQAAVAVLDADAALQRAERLHDSGTITLADHDTAVNASRRAHAGRAVADANVAAARAAFALAQANRDKATIRAPIAGVVLVRNVEPGQVVVSALQAAVLFRVAADLEHLEVRADVDEADVVKVAPGQEATFTVSAQPGSVYPARVRTVTNAPRLLQQVVTYEARLDVDNPAGTLRPGMTATVKIVTSHLPDVVLVPAQALRFVPSSARTPTATMGPPKTTQEATAPTSPRVWLLQGGVPVARAVVIIAGDGDRIAVTGVDGGDVVVVGEQAAR